MAGGAQGSDAPTKPAVLTPRAQAIASAVQQVQAGLSEAEAVQVGHVDASIIGGDTDAAGAFLKAEIAYHPVAPVSLFANAGYDTDTGWGATGGVKVSF